MITGVVSAATGVQVIPSMPYHAGDRHGEGRTGAGARRVLHGRDAWRSPSISPRAGLLTAATALPGAVAMAASFAGMFIGQAVRTRMQPDVFRRWFLIAMILLGLYLASDALAEIYGIDSTDRADAKPAPLRKRIASARLQHRDADAEIDEQPAEQRG